MPKLPPDDWPHASLSRIIETQALDWHVQETGTGPSVLLLHGAGGSAHSWRDLIPHLAKTHHVIAIDLPGHGFSRTKRNSRVFSLDQMARSILELCRKENWSIEAVIGHSAGGALALRLAELGLSPRGQVIGLNAALGKFKGIAGVMFPIAAKLLATNPIAAQIMAQRAKSSGQIEALLAGTGSKILPEGVEFYRRLASDPDHIYGTLRMMANWQLDGLLARFARNLARTTLIVGDRDKTVPPDTSARAVARLPDGRVISLPALGHLAHEEAPEAVSRVILSTLSVERV